jgi:phosphate transport system substrate-binding protein
MFSPSRTPWLFISLMLAAFPALGEEIAIPGSGNPEYVLRKIADAFNASQTAHRVVVPPSNGTAGALRDVSEGTAALGRVGRPLKEAERTGGMTFVPLGRDAVVFVGGSGVTVRSVTWNQMYDVYSGKVTDWRELGGKPGPIRAVGREPSDASRGVIDRAMASFATIQYAESVKVVHLDPQLLEVLDRFPTSIGFLNRSALYAAKTAVVPLALDSVEPTLENLSSGRYPLWLEFGLVYRSGKLTDGARAFLAYLETPAAARVIREHGVHSLVSGAAKAH